MESSTRRSLHLLRIPATYYNVNDASVPPMSDRECGNQGQSPSQFSNPLSVPRQTATPDPCLSTSSPKSYSQSGGMNKGVPAHLTVSPSIEMHLNTNDQMLGLPRPVRQPVLCLSRDALALRTTLKEHGDGFKVLTDTQVKVPGVNQRMSVIYNSTLFSDLVITPAPAVPTSGSYQATQMLPPHCSRFYNLHDGQMAQSQPSTNSRLRNASLHRPLFPYTQTASVQMQRPFNVGLGHEAGRLGASQRLGELQDNTPDIMSLKSAVQENSMSERDANVHLFSKNVAPAFNQHFGHAQHKIPTRINKLDCINSNRTDTQKIEAEQRQIAARTENLTSFNFASPVVTTYAHVVPSPSQSYRTLAQPVQQKEMQTLPARLTSTESSASRNSVLSLQNDYTSVEMSTCVASAPHSSAFNCKFHGCIERFESLQKSGEHQRERSRDTTTGTLPASRIGSSMTLAELAARNSRRGPHKCKCINPNTGRPCNTLFSRPYDLTRHENTIHNVRKRRLRCVLCPDDKTFSRNDALMKHMRTRHREVDLPSKHRRPDERLAR